MVSFFLCLSMKFQAKKTRKGYYNNTTGLVILKRVHRTRFSECVYLKR